MQLVKGEKQLREPSKPISVKKGIELGRKMLTFLLRWNAQHTTKRAVGLAAPQIGENVRVCVLLLGDKRNLILVNPRITKHSKVMIPWVEECLSFPGKKVATYRYLWVEVEADNFPRETFGLTQTGMAAPGTLVLQAVAMQHEIDHLDGILFFDRTNDETELANEQEEGRESTSQSACGGSLLCN